MSLRCLMTGSASNDRIRPDYRIGTFEMAAVEFVGLGRMGVSVVRHMRRHDLLLED